MALTGEFKCVRTIRSLPIMSLFGPKNASINGDGFRCEARRDGRLA